MVLVHQAVSLPKSRLGLAIAILAAKYVDHLSSPYFDFLRAWKYGARRRVEDTLQSALFETFQRTKGQFILLFPF